MSQDKATNSLRNARCADIKIAPKADIATAMEIPRHFTAFIARDHKVIDTRSISVHKLDCAG